MTSTNTISSPHAGGFDAREWLDRFERNGGRVMFDELCRPALGFIGFRNPFERQAEARAMISELTAPQLALVGQARLLEAQEFDPVEWFIAFGEAGGSAYAHDGQAWTGAPEQDDDRALNMRNRLLPEEEDKLRVFLRQLLKIEKPA